jgi:hypothetical protein
MSHTNLTLTLTAIETQSQRRVDAAGHDATSPLQGDAIRTLTAPQKFFQKMNLLKKLLSPQQNLAKVLPYLVRVFYW